MDRKVDKSEQAESARQEQAEVVRPETAEIVRNPAAELMPFTLAAKSLRESIFELQALLDSRASIADIREAMARHETAETKFRPRYFSSVKGLTLEANQEAADLLESSREVAYRAVKRTGLAPK
jgi:hypothetical protein